MWGAGYLGASPVLEPHQPLVWGSDPRAAGGTAPVACKRFPQVCRTRALVAWREGELGPSRTQGDWAWPQPEPGDGKLPAPCARGRRAPPLAQLATKIKSCRLFLGRPGPRRGSGGEGRLDRKPRAPPRSLLEGAACSPGRRRLLAVAPDAGPGRVDVSCLVGFVAAAWI